MRYTMMAALMLVAGCGFLRTTTEHAAPEVRCVTVNGEVYRTRSVCQARQNVLLRQLARKEP